ncbi:ABC transporter permease subunit [Bacillus weihaiensis]|uniref:Permease n=1 Tax=Bacillus weihaiensis TaxID=1547283 RepID=A0A1L3MTU3_9BACI|nr:ABC transporter permease subunit [Bacillus weihaiensis]APH05756.1 permease [Bacillus weihaiensis]
MNLSLYKQMMKSNLHLFLSFGIGSAIYVALMTSLFPMIAENTEEIDEFIKLFPESLKQGLGLESLGSYGQFISAEYFGLLFPIILGVFCVMVTTQLLAKLVDQGSMAYLLSTRVTRSQVALTQAVVFISGLILIMLFTFLGGLGAGKLLLDDQYQIGIELFFQLNIVGFLLFFAVGGYSFFISSLVNDQKLALGLSGGLTFLFFGLDMIGKLSTEFEWIRKISLFSLYEPNKIAGGDLGIIGSSITLFLIGVLTFVGAVLVFKRRNLPL